MTSTKDQPPVIFLLMTGNEILAGDIIDTNAARIAQTLHTLHLPVAKKVTVGDHKVLLTREIRTCIHQADLVFINGGLGPTVDDLTCEAIALATGLPLEEHPHALNHLEKWCKQKQIDLTASNRKQALLPKGARIFSQSPGSAPAFSLVAEKTLIISTPGVPFELSHLLEQAIPDFLSGFYPNTERHPFHKATLFGIGESPLQEKINASALPKEDVEYGFRAHTPYIEFKYRYARAFKPEALAARQKTLDALIAPYLVGPLETDMAEALSKILKEENATMSCAESCTGGLIARMMTEKPGASACFDGGLVTYSNACKTHLLGVPEALLAEYGAVSEQTALAMLKGLFAATQTDFGISVTGIAGPSGGTEEKPVGTVFIAFGAAKQPAVVQLCLPLSRSLFQTYVATIAMDLLRHCISGRPSPIYLKRWLVNPQ